MSRSRTSVPILMYHSISDDTGSAGFQKFVISPQTFASQLAHLAENDYQPISVTQYVQAMRGQVALPQRPIVLTFDDGFQDFHTQALPLLKKFGFTATLYITTGFIGGTSRWLSESGDGQRPMLNVAQIQEIAASNIEIGAHTHTHPMLDMLPQKQVVEEVERPKAILEDALGAPVESFAYPFGYYSDAVKRAVEAAGYTSACAVRYSLSSLDDDRFALARLIVPADMSAAAFANAAQGKIFKLASQVQQVRGRIWKFVRLSKSFVSQQDMKYGGTNV